MKPSFTFSGLVLALSLAGCAKKAAPDRMFCDCLDKETTDYLTAHPAFTANEAGEAAAAIGAPCMKQLKEAYSEEEMSDFKGKEQRRINAACEECAASTEAKLKEAAQ